MDQIKDEDIVAHDISDQDILDSSEKPEPSTLSDIATGAGQGVTFGFSDEIIAAAKALAKTSASKEKKLNDLFSLYRELQQIEQLKAKEAKERSPFAYTAGELGGAILPALFTGGGPAVAGRAAATAGGVAEAATAAKTATAAAKAAAAAKETAAGAEAGKGLLAAIKEGVIGGATTGAKYGALSAAGTSETPIEDTKDFGKEVLSGGLYGGTIGGAFGALGGIGKSLISGAKETEVGRQMATQYEEMKKPDAKLFGTEAKVEQVAREGEVSEQIRKQLLAGQDQVAGKITKLLKKAEDQVIEVSKDTRKLLKQAYQKDPFIFSSNDANAVFGKNGFYQKLKNGELTPEEANNFRKILKETWQKKKMDPAASFSADAIKQISDELYVSLENKVKGFKAANKDYDLFTSATIETLLGKGTYTREVPVFKSSAPIKTSEKFFSDVTDKATALQNSIKSVIEKLQTPGMSPRDKIATISQLEENLQILKSKRPTLLKLAKIDPEQLIKTLKYEADVSSGVAGRFGYEPQAGAFKQAFNLMTPRGAGLTGAAALGKVTGELSRSAPAKLASFVYSRAEPELRKISDALLQSPLTKSFGESLARSLESPGSVSRKAVLFSIMQSHDARKAISKLYPGMEEE